MKLVRGLVRAVPVVSGVVTISAVLVLFLFTTYIVGFSQGFSGGFNEGVRASQEQINEIFSEESTAEVVNIQRTPTPILQISPSWGGPDLWEAVNKRRQELGVHGLANQSELCTIASIRLNELLELGKLDAHEGFSNLTERRPDLEWIFDKYNITEFLIQGAESPENAVDLWENTLGHKKLLTGGEYVWGCIYAQNSFGVAITGF